ncbi:MAG: hypothetical protein GY699_03340 [Desulfobacteraceae bacterium]|nr:hypothetical protein [Desulfobacteraceae bacterium]
MKILSKLKIYTNQNTFLLSVLVFFITFTIRIIFIFETMDNPIFRTLNPGMDNHLHWHAARLLLAGANEMEPCFELMMCSTPLHQYWLAFFQIIIGDTLIFHRIINTIVASLSAVLIFGLIKNLVGSRSIAFICSLMWAMLPSLIYFDGTIHKSAVEILVLMTLIYAVLDKIKLSGGTNHFYIKGIIIGGLLSALLLLQGNTFLYFLVILVCLLLYPNLSFRRKIIVSLPTVIIFLSVFSYIHVIKDTKEKRYPWTQPVKGIHFNIGFHEGANGFYHKVKGIPSWPYGHTFYSRMYAEAQMKKKMTPAEADQFFMDQGIGFIKNNPGEAIKLSIKKMQFFFSNFEAKGIDYLYFLQKQSKVLKFTPMGLGIIVILAGLGVIRLIYKKEYLILTLFGGLLSVMLISSILGFISWRYRLHNIVPLTVFAAYGILFLKEKTTHLIFSSQPVGYRIFVYCLFIVFPLFVLGGLTYKPVPEKVKTAFNKYASINAKHSKKAEGHIIELEQIKNIPSLNQKQLAKKAWLLRKLHRHTESYDILKTLHEKKIYRSNSCYQYLRYLLWLGDYDKAVTLIRDVKRVDPKLISFSEKRLKGVEKVVYDLFVKNPTRKPKKIFTKNG